MPQSYSNWFSPTFSVKFHSDKARLENVSREEPILEMYPVLVLASYLFFWFCSAALSGCFFAGSFSPRWQFTSGAAQWGRRNHLPPTLEKHHDQLAPRAQLLSPLSPLPKSPHSGVTVAVICQLWPFMNATTWSPWCAKEGWWTPNLERFQRFWNNAGQLPSAPVWAWKWICAAQLSSLQSWGSQIQEWKLSHKSKSTGLLLRLTACAALSVHYCDLHSITEQN